MTCRRRPLLLLTIFALAVWCGRADGALPKPKEAWIRVETDHFVLFSNAPENRTVQIGQNLEILRYVLSQTTSGLEINSPLPTKIYVFRDAKSFDRYNLRHDGKPANVSGYFVKSSDGNYVALDADSGDEPFRVIYHEYLHYFLGNNFPDLPVWINEGLAEFYSTFDWRGAKAELGHPIPGHLVWLRLNEMMPLDRLFAVDEGSADYNEAERQGTFYAQSWLFTHFMMMRDEGKSAGRLLQSLDAGGDPVKVVQQILGQELVAVEQKLDEYAAQESFKYFTFKFAEKLAKAEPAITPVERTELLYQLGDLLLHAQPQRADDVEEHLQAALELAPMRTDATVALAVLRSFQDRPDDAAALFEKAIQLGTENPWAYKAYGSLILERWFDAGQPASDGTPPELVKARELFRKSLALVPDDPESLAGLGTTYLRETGDPAEGVDALGHAVELLPSRTDLQYNYLLLLVQAGEEKRARDLVNGPMRRRADRKTLREAEDTLLQFDLERARTQLESGLVDEGIATLQSVADRSHDENLKQQVLMQLMTLSDGEVSADAVDLFNQAVAKANGGETDQAIGLLQQVVQSATDPALKKMAQSTLESLQRLQRHNRIVTRFNEGVRAANAGRFDDAIAHLREALEMGPEEDLRGQIESILGDLERSRKRGR